MGGNLFGAVMAVGLLLLGWGFAQFLLHLRWGRAELDSASKRQAVAPDGFRLAVLVPCLDEEAVIGDTVSALRTLVPDALIVVIDDGSGDGTAQVAASAGAHIVGRTLPNARLGKGPALNHGYQELVRLATAEGLEPERTVVCVMDADGRLSANAPAEVLSRFADPTVGGVQLPVRIRNRETFLGRMQDLEFWGMSALAQMARTRTRSVSLGGNGQFTRLAALQTVGPEPWSDALTEDLDLGVELTLRGWALVCAPTAWVSQQGVETVDALVRQRTRWYQGHMLCASKARALWDSELVPRRTALETTLYLLTPVFVMLPWSIAFTIALAAFFHLVTGSDAIPLDGTYVDVGFYAAFWYILTFLPSITLGLVYAERTDDTSRLRGVWLGHVQVAYGYLTFIAGWRAVVRIALGRHGWAKTRRIQEESA